jgi:sulfite exporter TauE/SafE
MAGVGSTLRRVMTLVTGGLLLGLGFRQIAPQLLPAWPVLQPLTRYLGQPLHHRMTQVAGRDRRWTPLLLGLVWGLIPCGFLYTAQIKAVDAGSWWGGGATLLAFGLGTVPTMLGVGVSSAWLSRDRASQLYQMGGWITLLMGVLTLMRTGDVMVDYTGHLALLCLGLALIARPIRKLWLLPLQFRRLLGVGAGVLEIAHTGHMLDHSWNWNLMAVRFLLPQHRWAMVAGGIGLMLMFPLILTSTDRAQRSLGKHWRSLHLLSLPALGLAGIHAILVCPSYLGSGQWSGQPMRHTLLLLCGGLLILAVRSPHCWRWLGLARWYTPPRSAADTSPPPHQTPTHSC